MQVRIQTVCCGPVQLGRLVDVMMTRLGCAALLLLIALSAGGLAETGAVWGEAIGASAFGVLQTDMHWEFEGGWVRPHPGPFIWGWIERSPGTYDWRELDSTVEKLQSRGLAILATVWPFASWDQAACHGSQPRAQGAFRELGNLLYAPCDMEAYLAWLRAMVERYDGDGVHDMPGLRHPVRHWEILNEPEMQGPELCFFQEDPQVYADLLRVSYEAVNAADPDAVVLPAGQSGMHSEAVDYWQPILADPTVPFDIGNIHSIRCSEIQEDAAFWGPEYAEFLLEVGRGAMPYWITEAATGSVDPRSKGVRNEDVGAQDRFVGTVCALASGAETIFHCLAYDPLGRKSQLEVEVFQTLGAAIGSFESTDRIGLSSVRFVLPDRREVYALWNGARLPASVVGEVRTTTYLGAVAQKSARDIRADVPMIVEVP